MADKFIQQAIKKPGALHQQMGVPNDQPIPLEQLKKAAKSGGKLGNRARLAILLRNVGKKPAGAKEAGEDPKEEATESAKQEAAEIKKEKTGKK